MSARCLVAVFAFAGVLVGAVPVLAQTSQPSLAEVARQEAERRKAMGKTTQKVYTNDDTKVGRPLTTASASMPRTQAADDKAGSGGGAGTPGAPAAGAQKPAGKADPAKDAKNALYQRILDVKEQISRNDVEAAKVQKQVDDLNERVLNSFDSVERANLIAQREAALAHFRKLQDDNEGLRKVVSDLEDDARRGPQGQVPQGAAPR